MPDFWPELGPELELEPEPEAPDLVEGADFEEPVLLRDAPAGLPRTTAMIRNPFFGNAFFAS